MNDKNKLMLGLSILLTIGFAANSLASFYISEASLHHKIAVNLTLSLVVTSLILLVVNLGVLRIKRHLQQVAKQDQEQLERAIAEAQAAQQARARLLAYISHDLRTPLATIIHYTHLLAPYADETTQRYQNAIERSAIHQLEIIEDLVEHARGELDHFELVPIPTYLHSYLQEIASQGELLASQQGNSFALELDGNIPPIAVIDPKRLRQVLLNLLTNAAKYTQDGQIKMLIHAGVNGNTNGLSLYFAISDTGPGISQEDAERIFLPFERCATDRPGVGLGLTIAHKVVRKMGGALRLESQPGAGSKFFFDIETVAALESEVLQPATAFALPEAIGAGKCILVVDDDLMNRDYLYEILAIADFDILLAESGEEALQMLRQHPVDIILTDQIMPGMNGWELLRHIHANEKLRDLPVLLYSGMPPEPPLEFPREIRFRATLFKPVLPDELLEQLRRIFHGDCPQLTQ
ncbi:ATPase [Novimethylophilus kurashikiensis]|uniref:histidine kinase n=1 Tax=Novimethylophilus kurashikiensis TaxID=1825523 RepID=A0A2R5F3N4_9PROT|nr:ATP-binding protein [Novimethylophilus kurashikiensis]GBG12699.1 ATPase [Novimethylophilus kurashikiensis]